MTCALCTGFVVAFAALARDARSTTPQYHLARVRRTLLVGQRDHDRSHRVGPWSAAIDENDDAYARFLCDLAEQINKRLAAIPAAEGNAST